MSEIKNLVIRHMEVSDIAPLANIEKQCFSRPWSAGDFGHLIDKSDAYYLVAEITDERGFRRIVGTAGMRIVCGEGDIDNVAVLPEFRNRGIAGALFGGIFYQIGKSAVLANILCAVCLIADLMFLFGITLFKLFSHMEKPVKNTCFSQALSVYSSRLKPSPWTSVESMTKVKALGSTSRIRRRVWASTLRRVTVTTICLSAPV